LPVGSSANNTLGLLINARDGDTLLPAAGQLRRRVLFPIGGPGARGAPTLTRSFRPYQPAKTAGARRSPARSSRRELNVWNTSDPGTADAGELRLADFATSTPSKK
jgi:hypothetical protein